MENRTIFIRNMVCRCCMLFVKQELERQGITVMDISPGKATITIDPSDKGMKEIGELLEGLGTGLVESREDHLVEQIKQGVIELVHHMNNMDSVVRKSEYLVEKTGLSYPYLARIFSAHENITLERFIILNKIERIKELIDQDEFSLSEIAFMMDYSSVQYLSTQFRNYAGMTVSEYKESDRSSKMSIDQLY